MAVLSKTERLNKLRGQKSLVSRVYNKKIQEALNGGNVGSARSYKAAKTVKLRQIDETYS